MPLFESQESRNSRLFADTYSHLLHSLHELVPDEHDREIYGAWLWGGGVVSDTVVEACHCVKKAWGKGDEKKALPLIKTFTLPMVSRWFRASDSFEEGEHSEDERRHACEVAASDILTLFGDYSEDAVKDFLNMDTQFNYEFDWLEGKVTTPKRSEATLIVHDVLQNPECYELTTELSQAIAVWCATQHAGHAMLKPKPGISLSDFIKQGAPPIQEGGIPGISLGVILTEACLLLSKACEACGQPSAIDLSAVTFPVEYFSDIYGAISDYREFDPDDAVRLLAAMNVGIVAMFKQAFLHDE